MKREEKNQRTRQKILDSALVEFSLKGYGVGSLNAICSSGGISKGIIYHYFDTKDALYLACVEQCFQALTGYMKETIRLDGASGETQLAAYFDARSSFFYLYPVYQRIFCDAVMRPPAHLLEAVKIRKAAFDALNVTILTRLIGPLHLRPGITKEEVIDTFRQYQDYVNASHETGGQGRADLEAHEARCHKALNILLYGVIERK